jgi:hypothetical protein
MNEKYFELNENNKYPITKINMLYNYNSISDNFYSNKLINNNLFTDNKGVLYNNFELLENFKF